MAGDNLLVDLGVDDGAHLREGRADGQSALHTNTQPSDKEPVD